MTYEDVKSCIGTIEMLKSLVFNVYGVMDVIDIANIEIIENFLEKQIPKKPIIKKYKPICPTCGVRLAVGCRCWQNSCGQAIDWSDEE